MTVAKSINTMITRLLSLCFLALTIISCSDPDGEPSSDKRGDSVSRSIEITDSEREVSQKGNVFAWNLLQQCMDLDEDGDNVVLSPMSANICLSMLANATSGESRAQILQALGFSDSDMDNINSLNCKLAKQICSLDDNVALSLANSLWYNVILEPKAAFLTALKDNYDIESFTINPTTFASDVNHWCNEKTKGLIPRILDDGVKKDFAFLNAIYFKGLWNSDYRFEKGNTIRDYFNNSDASRSNVYFMQKRGSYQYHQDQLWRAMRIPFGGGGFNFTVILPNEDSSVDECMASIVDFEPATAQFSRSELELKVPKLSLKHNQDLVEVLKRMGVSDIFNPSVADFSNMTEYDMVVDMAQQDVSFDLNEEGAEAAAVTIIGGIAAALPSRPLPFYIDRPFIFMISERSTGTILFLGRINKL